MPDAHDTLAILISGGLDSAILLGESLRRGAMVHPLYIRNGLAWEAIELEHLVRFLDAVRGPLLRPLKVLDMPVGDLYEAHWSLTGQNVPSASSPDEAVYLPARNVLLLSKALLWAHLNGVPAVAVATLRSNPFPDATPAFFDAYRDAVNRGIAGSVQILRPFAEKDKTDVLRLGPALPLDRTFSCIRPVSGRHCGDCNKCDERRHAFAEARIADRTDYAMGRQEPPA